ncbi:Arrestin domain-containing protein 3 [Bulinus truncatus]|nr:Arrestin domain-containing protein 3 [Bulinus truncatus]
MGKIKLCTVARNGDVFRPGETIYGTATLTVDGATKARSVNIFCCGMALTKWPRSYESTKVGTEYYIHEVLRKPVENLSSGNHEFNFRFLLPSEGLPSSYEGRHGSIRYFLRVEVDKPFPRINYNFYSIFTVLAHLDANLPEYKRGAKAAVTKEVHKAFGLGNVGNLTLSASIDRNGYCPGEKILIDLKAWNESVKDCGAVQASLVQNVIFSASGETQKSRTVIRSIVGAPLEKGKTRAWQQQPLQIDAVPPSHKMNTCHIIKVNYSVNVSVGVPLGMDLELSIPVTICTVPLGKSLATSSTLVQPDLYEISGSKSVNYKVCSYGFSKFGLSEGFFVCTSYAPMTAFATDDPSDTALVSPVAEGATAKTAGAAALPGAKGDQVKSDEKTALDAPSPVICNELPPTYEETIQGTTFGVDALPSYETPTHETGKGAAMVILFPEYHGELVTMCLKLNSLTLVQHGGKVMAYQSKISLLPNQATGAVVIHFPSSQAGLGWWQKIKMSEGTLTSKWWVIQGESEVDLGQPSPSNELTAVSLTFLKRSPDFQPTANYRDQHDTLLKESLNPAKKRFGGKTVVTFGDVMPISGDWSSAVPSASGVTLEVTQWPTVGHYEEYTGLFLTDPGLISYNQLFGMSFQILYRLVFPAGDIEDLVNHDS